MSTFVIGGSGFIGRRVVRLLATRGEDVVCLVRNPSSLQAEPPDERVRIVAGDLTDFNGLLSNMEAAAAERVINLAYSLGSDHPPHAAMKINVVGMANCFEAARLLDMKRVVYASSIGVGGKQSHYGERMVTEEDVCHGDNQYATHKIFNEWQARDYADKYGLPVVGVRPSNVTGPDKVHGSVDHVHCIAYPARGEPIVLPFGDLVRLPLHVDDIAEVFVRLLMAEKPKHSLYNSGGHQPISLRALAAMVREFIPDAEITFADEAGGRDQSGVYLIDNSRLTQEFRIQYPPLRSRVQQIISDIRSAKPSPKGRTATPRDASSPLQMPSTVP